MRAFIAAFCLLALGLGIGGCATIFGEQFDSMTLNSEPEGADVYWRGEHIGKTPFTYQMKRQTAASYLEFAKVGYEDKRIDLARKVEPTAWFNLGFLILAPSSVGTDVSTGAMWEYAPKSYVAKLMPAGRAEIWNERVMEFVIANEQVLKKELARGSGESLNSFCSMIKKTPEKCLTLTTRAKEDGALKSENGLTLYRALRAIDIEIKEDDR